MKRILLGVLGMALCGVATAQIVAGGSGQRAFPTNGSFAVGQFCTPVKHEGATGKHILGFGQGAYDNSIGIKYSASNDSTCCAICLPKSFLAVYKGGSITKIRIPINSADYISKAYVWLKKKGLADTPTEEMAKVTKIATGWTEVVLPESVAITGEEDLYIGASFISTGQSHPFTLNTKVAEEENALWAYNGKSWVNSSQSGYGNLSIEAVVEGLAEKTNDVCMLSLTANEPCFAAGKLLGMTAKVLNYGSNAVSKLIFTVRVNDQLLGNATRTVSLSKDALSTVSLSFNPKMMTAMDDVKVHVSITKVNDVANTETTDTAREVSVDYVDTLAQRNVVVEEGTGTWCGYCVRGIVAMEYMKKLHPDDFIGIAVHSGDALDSKDYIGYMGLSGYPSCNVDRQIMDQEISSSACVGYYNTEKAHLSVGTIGGTAEFSADNTTITASAMAKFYYWKLSGSYSCAFVLLEDSVTGYTQANYYAGGSMGSMGGFENLGSPCPVTYYDVDRGIFPGYHGSTFTNKVEANHVYQISQTIKVPAKVQRKNKLRMVFLLLDDNSGAIVNAQKVAIKKIDATGISASENAVEVIATEYYSLDGRRLSKMGRGIVIKKEYFNDGSAKVSKVLGR